ncbi:MAG: peptidylprolyl isomerase [Oscillospiraceae bacterium]|nr:peptidylprolyl isomerase [Oscillospiraceae bacterium]
MSASQQKKLRKQQREQGVEKRQIADQKAAEAAKKSSIRSTVITTIVVLLVIVTILFSSNLFYHAFPAVKIGDTSYNASELSFFYKSGYFNFVSQNGSYLQYMGLDTSKSLDSQSFGEDQTWADFFLDSAITSMTEITMLADEAEKAGFELPEEDKAALEQELAALDASYEGTGFSSLNAFLAANYGKGCNEKLIKGLIAKSYLAQAYATSVYDSYSYTDAELDAHYDENKNSYDNITYISYFVSAEENADEGIDSETAMANAKELADSLIADITSQEEFTESVLSKTEEEVSAVTIQGSSLSSAYSEWLLDASRKEGDMTVLATDSGYYALYFISRERNDSRTVSARHILTYVLADDEGVYTDEAKAEAKAKAEELLAQWKAGEATEESFAALANEYSDDPGSNTNGGLYENFKEGAMVAEFNDWCFDTTRKPGDTGIVFNEGSYCGYHVIYFIGEGETYDKVLSENALREEAYNEWKTAALENYTAKTTFTASLIK